MSLPQRARSIGLLLAGLVLLSACAETQLFFHTAKQVQRTDDAEQADPRYKIGEPYQIRGRWYYPAENYEYAETGIASWYGRDFHGLQTANGEIYNMNALTAAHRTLPMPSAVRVVNLENGRSLVVRVNDRGPFARGRIIDVSRKTARELGFERAGTAKVRVEILPSVSRELKLAALNGSDTIEPQLRVAAAPRVAVSRAPLETAGVSPAPANGYANTGVTSVLRQARLSEPVLPRRVQVVPVPASSIFIQVGAFSDLGNALRLRDRMYQGFPSAGISRAQFGTEELYRVRIGPFDDVQLADAMLLQVLNRVSPEAQLVVE